MIFKKPNNSTQYAALPFHVGISSYYHSATDESSHARVKLMSSSDYV